MSMRVLASSSALMATMIVLNDINAAPMVRIEQYPQG
jgi:hypothetical protein